MAENRKDMLTRDMFERICERIAESQTKAAAQGAEIALQKFSDMSPWDLSTRDGRDAMRETLEHADTSKRICNAIKKDGTKMAIKGFWGFVGISLIVGAFYMFGFDPAKLKILNGIK